MRASLLLLLLMALPAPAFAQSSEPCTEAVEISWEVDHDDATVTAGLVHAPGCPDGEPVELQLMTDDGPAPADPLQGEVSNEVARFDLDPLDVRMRPVIGVRVLMSGGTVEVVGIVVEQRFFAQNGNEQRGLIQTTTLEVPLHGTYEVPGAPARYDVVSCSDMGWTAPDDLVEQGAGPFTATEAGRHVVCYQQQSGTSGGPPDVEDPVVGDDTEVLGEQMTRPAPSTQRGAPLARTGADVLTLGMVGMILIAAGRRFVTVRRS